MIIESGIIIFIGFMLIALKLKHETLLRMLGKPLLVDLTASVIAYVIHFGTFTGVMAAAVAALMMSATISIGRKVFGYITTDAYNRPTYYVGSWDLLPDVEYSETDSTPHNAEP
jgi:hypothetical protein